MNMKNILILLIVLLFPSFQGFSAIFWEKTNMEDGLLVTCLAVDSTNQTWAGTTIGLYYYDYFSYKWRYGSHDSLFVINIKVLKIKGSKNFDSFIIFKNVLSDYSAIYIYFGDGWQIYGEGGNLNPTSLCIDSDSLIILSAIGDSNTSGVQTMDFNEDDGWRALNTGLPIENDSIRALDIVNKNDTIYVGLSNGLYYSTNDGTLWLSVPEFEGFEVDHFVLNTNNDLYFIVAGTNEKSGLYKNFNLIYNDVLPLSSVAVNRNDDVFVGSSINGKGVFWTSDNGTVWTEMYDGLDSSEVTALIADMDGYVYAGTNGTGIYRSLQSTTGVEEYYSNELKTFPNPFSESTNIRFSLDSPCFTKLIIYNTLGYEVAILVNEYLDTGNHEFTFDGDKLASGTYIYVLQAGSSVESGKLLLIK